MRSQSTIFIAILILVTLVGCKDSPPVFIDTPVKSSSALVPIKMDKERYYNKVLGALVGSAIGDAMGASTEMWHRDDIRKEFGYINGLTSVVREKSPEGIWLHNLPAGATTDDTRWKYLLVQYFSNHANHLSGRQFASFIIDYYQSMVNGLSAKETQMSTDLLDEKMDKVDWIKEWARVALAYEEGFDAFYRSHSRFYGGEMSCAGLLYTPMFGLIHRNPESAYLDAFDHTLFDVGYAKDISSLAAAMTSMALYTDDLDSILSAIEIVDPYNYKDSRLVGRLSSAIASESRDIIKASGNYPMSDSMLVLVPIGFPDSKRDWIRQNYIYSELEKRQKAIAFHAGEIWQITYTALLFGNGDFQKTMTFIVNYGRDNDTVAALTGFILGAIVGYDKLPLELKEDVVQASRDIIGIDLEQMAKEVVEKNWDRFQ